MEQAGLSRSEVRSDYPTITGNTLLLRCNIKLIPSSDTDSKKFLQMICSSKVSCGGRMEKAKFQLEGRGASAASEISGSTDIPHKVLKKEAYQVLRRYGDHPRFKAYRA